MRTCCAVHGRHSVPQMLNATSTDCAQGADAAQVEMAPQAAQSEAALGLVLQHYTSLRSAVFLDGCPSTSDAAQVDMVLQAAQSEAAQGLALQPHMSSWSGVQ